jgi:hypothetical protein
VTRIPAQREDTLLDERTFSCGLFLEGAEIRARLDAVALSVSKLVYSRGWSPTTFRSTSFDEAAKSAREYEVLPLRSTPEVGVIVCRNALGG